MQNSRYENLMFPVSSTLDYSSNEYLDKALFVKSELSFQRIIQKMKQNESVEINQELLRFFTEQKKHPEIEKQISNQRVDENGETFSLKSLCHCINNCIMEDLNIFQLLSDSKTTYREYEGKNLHYFVENVQKYCSHLTAWYLKYHNIGIFTTQRLTQLGYEHNKGFLIVDKRKDELAIHSFKNFTMWNSNTWEFTSSNSNNVLYIGSADFGLLLRQVSLSLNVVILYTNTIKLTTLFYYFIRYLFVIVRYLLSLL